MKAVKSLIAFLRKHELVSLLWFAVILFSARSAIADWNRIPTGSMEPSIRVGDLVWVNKLAYDLKFPFTTKHLATWGAPRRGEIVVFYGPKDSPDEGMRLIKRVIGTPGDIVEMHENHLSINGEPVNYSPLSADAVVNFGQATTLPTEFETEALVEKAHTVMSQPDVPALRSFDPVVVPEGKYLMLGDNRDNSADSRYFGLVDRQSIVGRATAVIISWDANHHYKPRLERFFTSLI